MSLLNLTNDGLPNVLIVLADWLCKERGGLEETELLGLVGAAEAVQEPRMVRQTMNKWIELGLFVKTGSVVDFPDLGEKWKGMSRPQFICALRRRARQCVFARPNNEKLWAVEGAKCADLTRALSWLLLQDIYKTSVGPTLEALEHQQIIDPTLRLVQNDTRRNGLQKWRAS